PLLAGRARASPRCSPEGRRPIMARHETSATPPRSGQQGEPVGALPEDLAAAERRAVCCIGRVEGLGWAIGSYQEPAPRRAQRRAQVGVRVGNFGGELLAAAKAASRAKYARDLFDE